MANRFPKLTHKRINERTSKLDDIETHILPGHLCSSVFICG
ncbi:hypothetical protein RBSWK_06199 [Rhodopirellula baltica SWK14]|uniref:Uncharacterized protein n=1 Tax=Rhodopirellula baltica SWK14 TaxID=993516 RepID=L7C6K0_RHOBT|nr:hypothetical protein RBSWK_06199 [Rhodopirellula baltica SWK14]